jgi:hypothetical protein
MEPIILDADDTRTLYQITTVDDLTISILVDGDGEEYSTTDWQGIQPMSLAEIEDYDWINLSDWQYR